MTEHLLLVDCSAFAYRAYYSLPAMRRQSDGEPTGAVLGFMSMIWRMLGAAQADQPTYAAAVFDAPGQNFRHKLFPAYKGNRDPARSLELENQLPLMRPVAEVLGLTPIEVKGFEADDVIATLAARAHKAGIRSTIVSSDKDFGQLVVDDWIEIVDPMQRARDPNKSPRRLEADIIAKFGVPPAQVPDVQALAGDAADGIKGMKGVGPDTAAKLVRRFGSLDKVLKNIDQVRFPKVRAELRKASDRKDGLGKITGSDRARVYLKLTTLRRNVLIKKPFVDMALRPIIRSHLEQVMKALDPAANVTALFGLDRQDIRTVERIADPLAWWREELLAPGQMLPAVPQCGFYQTRLIKGGPWVPARIWREPALDANGVDTGRDLLKCSVDGRAKDAMEMFTRLSMNPVKESVFKFGAADSAHAKAFRPDDPKATPNQPIDITKHAAPRNPRAKRKKSHV